MSIISMKWNDLDTDFSQEEQTVSIRLSEKAQRVSVNYGKGYTSFFSHLIDAALEDDSLVKKCL